jgi:hypothetical protein
VRTGTNIEIEMRRRDSKLVKKTLQHCGIVMLAGMHDFIFDIRDISERPDNWGNFHEIRPGACND